MDAALFCNERFIERDGRFTTPCDYDNWDPAHLIPWDRCAF